MATKYTYNPLSGKFDRIITDKTVKELIGDWDAISVNTTELPVGKYDLENITGNIALTLKDEKIGAEWEFSNVDFSIGTNTITVGEATDEFSDENGAYVTGALLINNSNDHLKIVKKTAGKYGVVYDGAISVQATTNVKFSGVYNAATNTPDLSLPENRIDGEGNFLKYIVNVAGTQDLGDGNKDLIAGDEIFWTSTTSYRLDQITPLKAVDGAIDLGLEDEKYTTPKQVKDYTDTFEYRGIAIDKASRPDFNTVPEGYTVFTIRNGMTYVNDRGAWRLLDYRGTVLEKSTLNGMALGTNLLDLEPNQIIYVRAEGKEYRWDADAGKWRDAHVTLRGQPLINAGELADELAHDYELRKIDTGEYVFNLGKVPSGDDIADTAGTGAWVKVVVVDSAGLRGEPVADIATLTALTAKDFELRKVADQDANYVFKLGVTPILATDVADDANTGSWVLTKEIETPTNVLVVKSEDRPVAPIDIVATITVVTGHDFNDLDYIDFNFKDNVGGVNRPWNVSRIDVTQFLLENSAYIWNYDNSFVQIDLVNAATGEVTITDNTRQAQYIGSIGYKKEQVGAGGGGIADVPLTARYQNNKFYNEGDFVIEQDPNTGLAVKWYADADFTSADEDFEANGFTQGADGLPLGVTTDITDQNIAYKSFKGADIYAAIYTLRDEQSVISIFRPPFGTSGSYGQINSRLKYAISTVDGRIYEAIVDEVTSQDDPSINKDQWRSTDTDYATPPNNGVLARNALNRLEVGSTYRLPPPINRRWIWAFVSSATVGNITINKFDNSAYSNLTEKSGRTLFYSDGTNWYKIDDPTIPVSDDVIFKDAAPNDADPTALVWVDTSTVGWDTYNRDLVTDPFGASVGTVFSETSPGDPTEVLLGEAAATTGTNVLNLSESLTDIKANYEYFRIIGVADRFGNPRSVDMLMRTDILVDGLVMRDELEGSASILTMNDNGAAVATLTNGSAGAGAQNLKFIGIKPAKILTVITPNEIEVDRTNLVNGSKLSYDAVNDKLIAATPVVSEGATLRNYFEITTLGDQNIGFTQDVEFGYDGIDACIVAGQGLTSRIPIDEDTATRVLEWVVRKTTTPQLLIIEGRDNPNSNGVYKLLNTTTGGVTTEQRGDANIAPTITHSVLDLGAYWRFTCTITSKYGNSTGGDFLFTFIAGNGYSPTAGAFIAHTENIYLGAVKYEKLGQVKQQWVAGDNYTGEFDTDGKEIFIHLLENTQANRAIGTGGINFTNGAAFFVENLIEAWGHIEQANQSQILVNDFDGTNKFRVYRANASHVAVDIVGYVPVSYKLFIKYTKQ